MSGGEFGYAYVRMQRFADDLEFRLRNDEDDDGKPLRWPDEVQEELVMIVADVAYAADIAYLAECLYSSDIGEKTFLAEIAKARTEHRKAIESVRIADDGL